MSDKPQSDDIRETLGAPTLLESAREAQRRAGNESRSSSQDDDPEGGGGGDNQWSVKRLNPLAPDTESGQTKGGRERKVVQPNGVVEDDDGVESTRGAASFLGKKLFGERFSGRVNEEGQQQEGQPGKSEEDPSKPSKKTDKQQQEEGGKEGDGEDGKQKVGKDGVRVTKSPKQSSGLTREDVAATVRATIEGLQSVGDKSSSADSSHDDPTQAAIDALSAKDKRNFAVMEKMADLSEGYKELPTQFLAFQKSKTEYAKAWQDEHPGEKIDWNEEEHQQWVADNQPEFDADDFDDARIEIRAEAVAKKQMESVNAKLEEANRKATEGTLRERMTETAKSEIGAFKEAFVPDSDWDLTTKQGRKAAEEEDPVLGGIAARWAEVLEQASEKLVRLYDGGGLWKADLNNDIDTYLATLAQQWEKSLAQQDIDSTKNKDGKLFSTRAEFRKMSKEQQENHWVIGREELLWILPRDIQERADREKEEELDRLQKIAEARGWRFDRESIMTQKKKVRSNPDGIDESGQRATRSAQDERGGDSGGSPPSSSSGSKVNSDARGRAAENKSFSELLVNKLFGRQSNGNE